MEKVFEYRSSTIVFQKEGNGFPVVLVHGFAEDSKVWNRQAEFLKNKFLLIIPDLPGSGASQMLNAKADISIDDYAECLHELLRHENISECVMLGHSMGGYITLAFAEKYPEALKAFGFVQSTAFADSEEKKATRKKGIDMMMHYGAYSFIKSTTPNLFGKKFKTEHPEEIEALIESGKKFSKEALQQYYRAMMNRPDRTHVLKSSKVPVLFILGTEDVAAPLNDVLQQVHLPEISYIHIIEGVGHMGIWEATAEINKKLLTFITDGILF